MKELLIVEDRDSHLDDCKIVLQNELPRWPIEIDVLFARTLEEALKLLPKANMVLTDVFFPFSDKSGPELPSGRQIVERCIIDQKPVVWVTSTYHDGSGTEEVSEWGRDRGLEMFDGGSEVGDGEALHKPWKEALYGLIYTDLGLELGECFFLNGGIVDRQGRRLRAGCYTVSPFFSDAQPIDPKREPILAKMAEMGFPRN